MPERPDFAKKVSRQNNWCGFLRPLASTSGRARQKRRRCRESPRSSRHERAGPPRTYGIDPDRSIEPGYHAKWVRGLCYVVERAQPNLMTVAGVILAAGAGSRFDDDEHKLRSRIGGRTVFEIALRSLIDADLDEAIVVTGAVDLGDLVPSEVSVVFNSAWASGQASSLQAAVGHCRDQGHEAMVVGLGDQPGVDPAALLGEVFAERHRSRQLFSGSKGSASTPSFFLSSTSTFCSASSSISALTWVPMSTYS